MNILTVYHLFFLSPENQRDRFDSTFAYAFISVDENHFLVSQTLFLAHKERNKLFLLLVTVVLFFGKKNLLLPLFIGIDKYLYALQKICRHPYGQDEPTLCRYLLL